MITFTKEQLIASAHARIEFAEMMLAGELEPLKERTWSIELELARIALASLEAEPVGYVDAEYAELLKSGHIESCSVYAEQGEGCITVYTAPPAPVSVPEWTNEQCMEFLSIAFRHAEIKGDFQLDDIRLGVKMVNGSRAAMLQGAEPVTTAYKLPDGWVLVPVEPTEDMIVHGFESEPDESFSDEKEWEAYDAMSGCQQAAHRAKLCWAAMISAAPKV
ncbi:TPA: hypothetical protein OUC51_002603 [Enterobacter hormaechei]|nr:hypothetical protein [Enterobacter hormaechei]